jgi:Phospholipase_D-nuclease N-terminal
VIWILIYVFIDIFRSRDLSGWAKALWFLFLLLIPLIGVLVYLVVRGSSMQERSVQQAQQQDRELRAYVQEAAGTQTSTADQLASWPSSLTCATGASARPRSSNARRPRSWPERGPQSADSPSIL